jgi:hypothetical protein
MGLGNAVRDSNYFEFDFFHAHANIKKGQAMGLYSFEFFNSSR